MTSHAQEEPNTDDRESDTDEYSDGFATDTTSLKSYVFEHTFQNGRRYQRHSLQDSAGAFPNDEKEQDRLDIYHHTQLLMLKGELFLAPISPDPQYVLDCGTGTGIWAIDFASTYPSAQVTGIDITPIQPQWTLPNCKFEVDDLEDVWTFKTNHFDFIHSRGLASIIQDWPKYLGQAIKHLAPGGYIELVEHDIPSRPPDGSWDGSNLERYVKCFSEALKGAGLSYHDGPSLANLCKEAGFEDIQIHKLVQPMGPWPKDKHLKLLGRYALLNAESGFEAYGLTLFTRVLGMPTEEAAELCSLAWKDLQNKKIHAQNYIYHVVARKPQTST